MTGGGPTSEPNQNQDPSNTPDNVVDANADFKKASFGESFKKVVGKVINKSYEIPISVSNQLSEAAAWLSDHLSHKRSLVEDGRIVRGVFKEASKELDKQKKKEEAEIKKRGGSSAPADTDQELSYSENELMRVTAQEMARDDSVLYIKDRNKTDKDGLLTYSIRVSAKRDEYQADRMARKVKKSLNRSAEKGRINYKRKDPNTGKVEKGAFEEPTIEFSIPNDISVQEYQELIKLAREFQEAATKEGVDIDEAASKLMARGMAISDGSMQAKGFELKLGDQSQAVHECNLAKLDMDHLLGTDGLHVDFVNPNNQTTIINSKIDRLNLTGGGTNGLLRTANSTLNGFQNKQYLYDSETQLQSKIDHYESTELGACSAMGRKNVEGQLDPYKASNPIITGFRLLGSIFPFSKVNKVYSYLSLENKDSQTYKKLEMYGSEGGFRSRRRLRKELKNKIFDRDKLPESVKQILANDLVSVSLRKDGKAKASLAMLASSKDFFKNLKIDVGENRDKYGIAMVTRKLGLECSMRYAGNDKYRYRIKIPYGENEGSNIDGECDIDFMIKLQRIAYSVEKRFARAAIEPDAEDKLGAQRRKKKNNEIKNFILKFLEEGIDANVASSETGPSEDVPEAAKAS